MHNFFTKHCVPCEGGTTPLLPEELRNYLPDVPQWSLDGMSRKIYRTFEFKDFVTALRFVNQVGDIAEMEGHHPDIHMFYNNATLDLTTHAIDGLSQNDFILGAKIDRLAEVFK